MESLCGGCCAEGKGLRRSTATSEFVVLYKKIKSNHPKSVEFNQSLPEAVVWSHAPLASQGPKLPTNIGMYK